MELNGNFKPPLRLEAHQLVPRGFRSQFRHKTLINKEGSASSAGSVTMFRRPLPRQPHSVCPRQ
jgi:hypothetical protein